MAKILIADDEGDIRRLLEFTLKNRGHEVVAVDSGLAALAATEGFTPDLAILDVNMPGMEGTNVARELRTRPSTASMPIMLLTALGGESDTLAGFASGADDYVVKPFNPRELAARVTALLARSAGTSRAPSSRPQGRILVVMGPKGGVGRTTVSANLAIAAQQGSEGRRTILLDANLLLGDVGVQMGTPTTRSILDLVPYAGKLDVSAVEHVLTRHPSGVEMLLRPEASEETELVTAPLLREIVQIAAAISDVLVIDSEARYDDERTLVLLEMAATVIVVLTPDVSSVRNARHFLDLSPKLGLDTSRIRWVVNKANTSSGVPLRDVASVLGVRPEELHALPDGGASVVARGNLGTPITIADGRSELARSLTRLAAGLVEVRAATK